jgi:hypothetical protein
MSKAYEKIPTVKLLPNSRCIPPRYRDLIYLHDSAVDIMINLEHTHAPMITADVRISDKIHAEQLLFVIDDRMQIIGVVTIQEYKAAAHSLKQEIIAKAIMTPLEQVLCLELENVRQSLVSNVITTLIENNQQYALVVEKNNTAHTVKGFFLASLISQGLSGDILYQHTQAELQQAFQLIF